MMRFVQKGNLASANKLDFPPLGKLSLPLFILALAALVYSTYGFEGVLLRDYSIYLYSGQRMAEGVPPYVSVFDHKGPLPSMLAGLGVMLSKWLNWDDIYAVRLVFLPRDASRSWRFIFWARTCSALRWRGFLEL